jgi:hypothetical protein
MLSNNEANFQDQLIKTTGDLQINTDTLFVDSSADRVGVGTASPLSALHVVGDRDNSPASVGIHMGATGNDYGIEICSPANEQMLIDFCTSSGSNDYMARIMYDDNGSNFQINTVNKEIRIDSGTADIDLNGNVVVESGKTFNGNLNSTRGMLINQTGEESGALNVGSYEVGKQGNGDFSNTRYGFAYACDVKLKKFVYQANRIGTQYTTSTKIVFRGWINGTAQAIYAYCDFSNTTNGDVTNQRFKNKFSSSPTSQVDIEPTITDNGYGAQISWETYSLSGYNTNVVGHRFTVVAETQEDM